MTNKNIPGETHTESRGNKVISCGCILVLAIIIVSVLIALWIMIEFSLILF